MRPLTFTVLDFLVELFNFGQITRPTKRKLCRVQSGNTKLRVPKMIFTHICFEKIGYTVYKDDTFC